jgi:hypothetical protein
MIIQTGAAPICGGAGALKVSQQLAAIETIKAGYDRYIITGGPGDLVSLGAAHLLRLS